MRFHTQAFRHDPDNGVFGDCYRTAVACLLDMERDDVPHVYDKGYVNETPGTEPMLAFLNSQSLHLIWCNFPGEMSLTDALRSADLFGNKLPFLLSGTSKNGTNHVVVCADAKIIHDPSIDQSGIVGPCNEGYWVIEWIVPFPAYVEGGA